MEPVVYTPVSAAANLRRSTIVGVALGVVGVVGDLDCRATRSWASFGLLGVALGALNNRMLQRSVLRFAANETVTKKQFGGSACSGWARSPCSPSRSALLDNPDGLGVFAGLAVFQILMLVGAAVPVFRCLRPTA